MRFSLRCVSKVKPFLIDGQAYVIRRNDLREYHPNLILERCAESPDFENLTLMLSPDYVKQMPILSGGGWDVWLFLEKNPTIPLRQEEADLYCQYHDLLYSRLTALHRGRYHKELIDALLSAFLFEFHDVLERFISVKPQTFTSSEKLFKTFIETLASTYPKSRSVAYYASRIHVLCQVPVGGMQGSQPSRRLRYNQSLRHQGHRVSAEAYAEKHQGNCLRARFSQSLVFRQVCKASPQDVSP